MKQKLLAALLEAGKRNSKTDQGSIQSIHDGAISLGATCTAVESKESAKLSPWLSEALRQDESLSAKHSKVRTAVDKHYQDSKHYAFTRDLFDKHVVVQAGPKMFQHSYTIGSDGGATLGNPTEVEQTYSPVGKDATESAREIEGDIVPLVEAAVSGDGKTRIKVIAPGWGSSGYYGAKMLERDGGEAFPTGTKMYLDHPTKAEEAARPERSVKDMAAVLTSPAKWDAAGKEGPGLYAEANVVPAFRDFINGAAKHIGVSIRAAGKSALGEAEGRKGPIIERIAVGKSIDFVTQAGAGGKILTESGRQAESLRQLFEAATSRETGEPVDEKTLQEAQAANAKLQEQLKRANEALLLIEAKDVVVKHLVGNKALPQLTRDRIVESLAKSPVVKDGKLDEPAFKTQIDEAVKFEMDYLAKVTGSGKVRGMGEGDLKESKTGGADSADASVATLTESFKAMGMSDKAAAIAAQGRP